MLHFGPRMDDSLKDLQFVRSLLALTLPAEQQPIALCPR